MKKSILTILMLMICLPAYSATFTITIPDDKLIEVINFCSANYGWQAMVDDGAGGLIPNPESEADICKRRLILEPIKELLNKSYRSQNTNDATLQTEADTRYSGITVQ